MRPALLRLLKRPSALSVLDSLISAPAGVEQLELRRDQRCLRCFSRSARQKQPTYTVHPENTASSEYPSQSTRRTPSFRIHNIKAPKTQAEHCVESGEQQVAANKGLSLFRIQTEKLEFESDIGHTRDIGTRLVDDPLYRNDFDLWVELLRYRQRHYGDLGTMVIWEALTDRLDDVQLPVDGDVAEFLWQSFINVGFKRNVVMAELAEYARELWDRSGKRWPKFYESVVGGFIERGMIHEAEAWHRKLRDPHLACPNDILRVLRPGIPVQQSTRAAAGLKSPDAQGFLPSLSAFRNVCRSIQGHQIYVPTISALLQHGLPAQEMVLMHLFLVGKGDHPRSYREIEPLIHSAEKRGLQSFRQKLRAYVNSRFPGETEKVEIKDSEIEDSQQCYSLPATTNGRDLLHEEKPVKDEIGARIFATDALKFELILSGLKMFGATSIGPQSLRELALRAHGSRDILEKLRLLQEAGVSIGDSVFSRLVRKLATENRGIVLADLLRSDQHPDVLEDARIQESLLLAYYLSHDWRLYNLTLVILGEIVDEGSDMFNIHFRKHMAAGEWALASKVVDELALRGKPLTTRSIDFMIRHALTPRRPGNGPVRTSDRSPKTEVLFVLRVLQRIIPLGAIVSSRLWIELIKRLGQTDCWIELRRCCLWLANQYSPSVPQKNTPMDIVSSTSAAQTGLAPSNSGQDPHILRTIFNRQLQEALVHWGFRKRVSSKFYRCNPNQLIPWVRGLALLRELERSGVDLQTSCIRRACRHRLAIVFGRNRRSSRPMNRMLRRENPYSLEKVFGDISRVWGVPSLFGGREYIDVFRLINPPSSKMSYRRTRKTLWRERTLRGPAFIQSRS